MTDLDELRSTVTGLIVNRGFMTTEIEPGVQEQIASEPQTETSSVISPVEAPAEKMVPQSEVNKLVVATKREAYERATRDAQKAPVINPEVTKEVEQHNVVQPSQSPSFDINDLAMKVASQMSENTRAEDERNAQQNMVMELAPKIQAAKERYQDFDEVTQRSDIANIPEVLAYSNIVDNSGDVVYEMAKSPQKIATFLGLAQRSPQLAASYVQELSGNITANAGSANNIAPSKPLDSLSPSNVGSNDGDATSVNYWKNQYKGKL